jgi:hypothetical protein
MTSLPPDLDRLGERLARAAGQTAEARRRRHERRRRVATAGAIGAVAFAVLTPGPLAPGMRNLAGACLAGEDLAPLGCDHPRGPQVRLPACEEPMVLHRPYAWR